MSAVIVATPDQLAELVREAVRDALEGAQADAVRALLDRSGIARALGVGTSTIDRLRRAGMPCLFLGDAPRFELEQCLAWLRAHRSAESTPGGQIP